jgi:hypothetical protein
LFEQWAAPAKAVAAHFFALIHTVHAIGHQDPEQSPIAH